MITCPYCWQTFGPWGAAAIEPCRMCERPLHRSLGWARPRRVVLLLETVNALQGIGVMVAGIAFVTGAITLPRLCAWIALALFVAGSVHIANGMLSWKTQLRRSSATMITGYPARIAGAAQVIFGVCALVLSAIGFAYLFQ